MQTALITGGTSGVGLSIAEALLAQNYKVYIVGQNEKKLRSVDARLSARYPGNIEPVQLDLSVTGNVKSFAQTFANENKSLDVLANVAGIMQPQRTETVEGIEKTFAIGYLSAFILSTQLVDIIEKAQHGRIVNVGGAPRFVLKKPLNFDELQYTRNYDAFRAAITTVHAKAVLTEILAGEYTAKGIDVNSFHPGWVRSDLMHDMPGRIKIVEKLIYPLMTAECKTGIYVSSSPEIQGLTGYFFSSPRKRVQLDYGESYKSSLLQKTDEILQAS